MLQDDLKRKQIKQDKAPASKKMTWSHWYGPKERRMLLELYPKAISSMPFFKSAKYARLPKGLAETKAADSYYQYLRKGNNFLGEQFWKSIATLLADHGRESGVKQEVLWKHDSRLLDWNGSEFIKGIDENGKPVDAALILTKRWLYFAHGELVMVFSPTSLPSLPTFAPGLMAGKLILPFAFLRKTLSAEDGAIVLKATGGIGLDHLPILKANELFALLKKHGWGSWD